MESLESDTDEKRASLLSILSKVHYQGRMKRKGHTTHNVYRVCVVLLMSQQDMLYLAMI